MANQTGKRYVCGVCGTEMLVTKAGDGALACCDQPMAVSGASGAGAGQPKPGSGEAKDA